MAQGWWCSTYTGKSGETVIEEKLLAAYLSELEALRTYGSELAREYPDIAARLDIGPRQSQDGHVERVVESAAFLAARLRMMIEASAAELPMTMLSVLAPTLLEPVPSMAIAEFRGGSEPHDVPRGVRLDCHVSNQSLLCFRTTMAVTVAPLELTTRRLKPREGWADGIAIEIKGAPPKGMKFYLGSDELSAAALIDGLSKDLRAIEVMPRGAKEPAALSPNRLIMHGMRPDESALPHRPGTLHAHRLITEFICFPEKFRFASIADCPLKHGTEIRFWFTKPLKIGAVDYRTLVTANRVPVVNLWPASATPFDVTGRQLEYPVRVDALRYRVLECHSVESVQMYGPAGGRAKQLDPLNGTGSPAGSSIQWGTRRSISRAGAEVMLFFRGLDYELLGRRQFLAAPSVLASNGPRSQSARAGSELTPIESLGDWNCALAGAPTPYRPGLADSKSMRTLVGFLQSSLTGIAAGDRGHSLRAYLQRFPGGSGASWIDGIGRVSVRPSMGVRDGHPRSGVCVFVAFNAARARSTSRSTVERVLRELFESQRGLNRIEEVVVVAS